MALNTLKCNHLTPLGFKGLIVTSLFASDQQNFVSVEYKLLLHLVTSHRRHWVNIKMRSKTVQQIQLYFVGQFYF